MVFDRDVACEVNRCAISATLRLTGTRRRGRIACRWTLVPFVVVCLAVSTAPASSQTTSLVETLPSDQAAQLTYANRPITILRARLLTSSPSQRVAAAVARLDAAVASGAIAPVTTSSAQGVIFLRVANQAVLTLVPADLDELSGETLDMKAADAAARLTTALSEAAELRAPGRLVRSVLTASIASLLFVALLIAAGRLSRHIKRMLHLGAQRCVEKVLPAAIARERTACMAWMAERVSAGLVLLVWFVLAYWWVQFVLRQFPYSRPLGESLRSRLLDRATSLGLGIAGAIPDLVAVVLIVACTRVLIGLSNAFFSGIERGTISTPWAEPDTARATRRLAATLLWVFALILAYPYLPGSNTDAFKGVSVFVGLIVSLGSAGVINQLMSGFTLIYSRAIRVGDAVRIGDVDGIVTGMHFLSIKMRTARGEEITIPNAVVIGQSITDHTKLAPSGSTYLSTEVTIGYDEPWRQVRALLLTAASRTRHVRREPKPRVFQRGLEGFSVRYCLVVCVDDPPQRAHTLDELLGNIQDAFNEHGIQIMTPAYESDPEQPKIVPKERWFPPAA